MGVKIFRRFPLFMGKNSSQGSSFNGFKLDFFARIFTTFFSAVFYFLVAKKFGIESFSTFQLVTVYSALLLWFGDLGLGAQLINLLALENRDQFKKTWTIRFLFSMMFVGVPSLFALKFIPAINVFLLVSVGIDLFVDSNYNIRILYSNQWRRFLSQPIRKLLQIIIFVILSNFHVLNKVLILGLSILVPSIIALSFDLHKIGRLEIGRLEKGQYRNSLNSWLQGASNYFTILDNILLNSVGLHWIIALMAIPRKFTQSISIFSTVTAPRNQHSVARQNGINRSNINKILQSSVIIFFCSLPLLICQKSIFNFLFNISLSSKGLFLVSAVILCAPLQALVVGLNSLYFGLGNFHIPAIVSNLVAIFYLLFLQIFLHLHIDPQIAIGILLLSKTTLEFLVLVFFLLLKYFERKSHA